MYPFDKYEKFFSMFSGHMLEFKGVLYTTCEHAYHCQRFTDPKILEEIKTARSSMKAWEIAQKYKSLQLPNWDEKKQGVMEEILRAKLAQHDDVKKSLIESGEQELVKHQEDKFWADGLDGTGQNITGKIWMKLRAELK